MHRNTCSCPDSAIKWNLCKHIHHVCQFFLEDEKRNDEDDRSVEDEDNLCIIESYESDFVLEQIQKDNNANGKYDKQNSIEERKNK